MDNLVHLHDPFADNIPEQVEHWLARLPGAIQIRLNGADAGRTRALVTLLHGNEPSGLRAIHAWLRQGREQIEAQLATNLVLILANVEAARTPPLFHHRQLPGLRDLNRCFRAPWTDAPGRLAQSVLATLVECGPEAVVDLHNTSGRSPAFAVAAIDDARHRTLAGMFCNHLIVTELRMGALMDSAETLFPTLTVECGGAHDPAAHQCAAEVLRRFGSRPSLFSPQPATGTLHVFHNPVRVELAPGASVSFSTEQPADVILDANVQARNFGVTMPEERLARLRDGQAGLLSVRDHRGRPVFSELFQISGYYLTPRVPLRLFMATDRADIARSDCLFYIARAQ